MRWLRNQVVAPLTEELVFRACMLPMLVPCAGPSTAIFTCPLFFGVGELSQTLSIHPSIHPSIHSSTHSSIRPSIHFLPHLGLGHRYSACLTSTLSTTIIVMHNIYIRPINYLSSEQNLHYRQSPDNEIANE